jgi:hypothetical protein
MPASSKKERDIFKQVKNDTWPALLTGFFFFFLLLQWPSI